jgi:hypothetical protein
MSLSKRNWIGIAACAALVIAPALWLRTNFGYTLFVVLISTSVWPFSGAMWALGHWFASRSKPPRNRRVSFAVAAFFKTVFVATACFVGSLFVGTVVYRYDCYAAKHWCEARIENVERFRAANGRLPTKLAEIADTASGPLLVRDGSTQFHTSGDNYSFEIDYPLPDDYANWNSTRHCWDD